MGRSAPGNAVDGAQAPDATGARPGPGWFKRMLLTNASVELASCHRYGKPLRDKMVRRLLQQHGRYRDAGKEGRAQMEQIARASIRVALDARWEIGFNLILPLYGASPESVPGLSSEDLNLLQSVDPGVLIHHLALIEWDRYQVDRRDFWSMMVHGRDAFRVHLLRAGMTTLTLVGAAFGLHEGLLSLETKVVFGLSLILAGIQFKLRSWARDLGGAVQEAVGFAVELHGRAAEP